MKERGAKATCAKKVRTVLNMFSEIIKQESIFKKRFYTLGNFTGL
jgi:hypothetical protein